MAKEIYISTTPHETRLAIVEDEQLAEIYYERENEYTLAGSIYNGKVTRVLPGMQSSFVDIGLERDAFLYVTDFMEEQGDAADFETEGSRKPQSSREDTRVDARAGERGDRRGRGVRDRGRPAAEPAGETLSFEEPVAPRPVEASAATEIEQENSPDGQGSRRWRGRRGRRRGRGFREAEPTPVQASAHSSEEAEYAPETIVIEGASDEPEFGSAVEIDLDSETAPQETAQDRARMSRREEVRRGRVRDRARTEQESSGLPAATSPLPSAYATSSATEAPFVLPGESIRKYSGPAEAQSDDEKRPSAPVIQTVAAPVAPAFEVTGWDGGAVLPGETLSRHRAKPQSAAGFSPVPVAPQKAFDQAPQHSVETPSRDTEVEQHLTHSADDDAQVQTEVVAAAESEVAVPSAGEYEPAEGESAFLREDSRRDLRRMEQRPEAEDAKSEATAELAGEQPDPTTYDLQASDAVEVPLEGEHAPEVQAGAEHAFTSIQANGEMLSETLGPDEGPQSSPATQDAQGIEPFALQEGAIYSETADAEFMPATAQVPDFADAISGAETVPQVHAYGEGDLHEEEVDGDEYEYDLAPASAEEDEFDEYEEETLDDGAEDVGAMLHEMVVDQASVAAEEEEDDEADDVGAGGFSVADFGGEPDEEIGEEGRGEASSQPERRGRRDNRRSGRERDRRPGGGFRGGAGGDRGRSRGRQSVQTMDLPAINELLKPGQEILVQIAKEPIAKKGARITSHIALPGRFLVFMPTVNHTGVSRKISSDEERRRLKSILLSEKGEAQGGFIVRTAADGASEEELRNDLRFLIQLWQDIKMRSESSKSPALIYHDLSLIERILRDQVTDNFSAIWVDTEGEYERVLRFLQRFQPSLVRRVKLYTKETPLFEHFGVTQEIDKALKSKVWLKSGGSIVIDQTEALVAIDINTGKYVGKTARLEDTILKTNLDAIPEIVRQIRLRDLGGIIVVDFIDMDERKNRAKVMQVLEDELKSDRAPSKVLPFNDFGLVIMTRKRVKQSLERTLCIPDPVTEGTGMIKSPITVANEIYIEMRKMHRHLEKGDVMLRVHPEVVKQLKAAGGKRLQELEEMTYKTILVKSDPALSPEQFDIH